MADPSSRGGSLAAGPFRIQGDYLGNDSAQWLKTAPLANPAMLEMFRDRVGRLRSEG